jgi:hypothetical protein
MAFRLFEVVCSQFIKWIKGILTPFSSFGIPSANSHLFQIYVVVLGDLLWFSKNQAIHKGVIPKVSTLAANIK